MENDEFTEFYLKLGDTCKLFASPVPSLIFFKINQTSFKMKSTKLYGIIIAFY